jgi:CheY-like chemotaxis protein
MNNGSIDILVIDDDELTAEIVERRLRDTLLQHRVIAACDGQDALDVLKGKSDRRVRSPYIILLDLNMPRMNGFEFLEALRADAELRDSVVFVLSTSDADADRSRAYHELVAGYMVKSAVGPQFSKLAKLLKQYTETIWLPS